MTRRGRRPGGANPGSKRVRTPSRQTLATVPQRAALFLRVMRTHAQLRAALGEAGYDEAEHAEGQRLLQAATAWPGPPPELHADRDARQATAQVHAWTADYLPRLHAAAERLHPEHAALFDAPGRLDAGAALLFTAQLLERLDALDARDELFDTLARRGFGPEARAELSDALHAASRARPVPAGAASATSATTSTDDELVALYRWLRDWSTTAHSVIRRRDWLIALGLTRPAPRRKAAAER